MFSEFRCFFECFSALWSWLLNNPVTTASTYLPINEVFTLLHEFLRIPSGKSEFRGIPWNFNGKQLAGASAILVSNSMEIPTFFQGIPTEMVGIPEPPGMIPMGITIIYIAKNSYNIKN